MGKYTDEEIRAMPKITLKIAADYLGISPMMVSLGMRNNLLPIGFLPKMRTHIEAMVGVMLSFPRGSSHTITAKSTKYRLKELRKICRALSAVSKR